MAVALQLTKALRKISKDIIENFGDTRVIYRNVVLTSEVVGNELYGYDATTGTLGTNSYRNDDYLIPAILEDVTAAEVSDLIEADDKKLMFAAAAFGVDASGEQLVIPDLMDKIVINKDLDNEKLFQIKKIETIQPSGMPIVYRLYLKG